MLTFTAYALDGFAYAVEAHSGQPTARATAASCWRWRAACRQSGMVALAFALVYSRRGVHHRAVNLAAFLQQLADRYLIWQTILPVVGVWCYLLDGMFIGATRGAEMRNSMAVAAAGFAVTLLRSRRSAITACGWRWRCFSRCEACRGADLAPPLATRHRFVSPFSARHYR